MVRQRGGERVRQEAEKRAGRIGVSMAEENLGDICGSRLLGKAAKANLFKGGLLAMPNVGEEADFKRRAADRSGPGRVRRFSGRYQCPERNCGQKNVRRRRAAMVEEGRVGTVVHQSDGLGESSQGSSGSPRDRAQARALEKMVCGANEFQTMLPWMNKWRTMAICLRTSVPSDAFWRDSAVHADRGKRAKTFRHTG